MKKFLAEIAAVMGGASYWLPVCLVLWSSITLGIVVFATGQDMESGNWWGDRRISIGLNRRDPSHLSRAVSIEAEAAARSGT